MGSVHHARRGTTGPAPQGSGPGMGTVVSLLIAAAVLGGAWWWWSRENPVSDTLELQRLVLDEAVSGRQLRLAIDRISRNVDHMSGQQVEEVRDALSTGMEALRAKSIDDYFAAQAAAEKEAVLDRYLARQAVIEDLRSAVRNHSWGAGGRPRRRPDAAASKQPAPEPSAAEKELAKARRELEEQYFSALKKRAAEKGMTLSNRR